MTTPMMSLEERYRLAFSLGFGKREAMLLHGPVRPWWSADGAQFWYATRGADGTRHVLVDVPSRRKTDLFDHAALAGALAQATGTEVKPGALALAEIQFDHASAGVAFVAEKVRWRWQDATRQLERLGEAFGAHESEAPDGSSAVSLSGPNLQIRDLGQTDTRALTTDGEPDWGYGDFTDCTAQVTGRTQATPLKPYVVWSPDSQRLAVMRVDQRKLPMNHLVQSVPPQGVRPVLHSYRYPMPMDDQGAELELWFIDRNGERVRAQVEGLESRCFLPLGMQHGRWSADGRHFDLLVDSRDVRQVVLWRIDTRTGVARQLLQEGGPAVVLPKAALAEVPMFRVLRDDRVLWWSQRSGWGHLYLHGPGVEPQAVTHGAWLVRSVLHVDESRQRIVFTASGREPGIDPYFCMAYSVAFDGSGLTLLTPDPAHHDFVQAVAVPAGDGTASMAPDGAHFVDVWSTVTAPPRSVLRDRNGAVVMDLQTADPAGGWSEGMPLPEPFSVQALDGAALGGCTDLWGVLYKPPGFDPTKRYPVIEEIYGAPQTAVVSKGWSSGVHASYAEQLAALGFVVVMIDGPGTTYRSRAFQLVSYGKLESCGSLPDHVNAIRQLAAARPWMDLDRVGITGGSGGGYATVRALATYPGFYKVGVAMCGNHDSHAYVASWGDTYMGPYDEARYAAQDNTAVAANISGDLLLIHGDMDDNVHPAMTMRMVDALIKADRNFDLLIVPNVGHAVIVSPYVQRRAFDYFVERLAGLEPPRPAAPAGLHGP